MSQSFYSLVRRYMRFFAAAATVATSSFALAQPSLPTEVQAALTRAKITPNAVSFFVAPVDSSQTPRLEWRAAEQMNPASVMKLVTTYAALDMLGPAYTWRTPIILAGDIANGAFRGTVYIQGSGDPKLVTENLWMMLNRLKSLGIQVIVGDIVIDRSAFQVTNHDAAAFDGEPFKPYNAGPDAFLVNFKTQVLSFVPDPAAGVARIHYALPLANTVAPDSVPLAKAGSACSDWRGQLQARWSDPQRIELLGSYPASCGEKNWAVALPEPQRFALNAVEGMWRSLGGNITGKVIEGFVPAGLQPTLVHNSPSLAEVVRDVNKFSNNVMTQQLLLTMGKEKSGVGNFESARQVLAQWWQQNWPTAQQPIVENGAGLSRKARISAQDLGKMLQTAWASPVMPELTASLPITGTDGTLRRSKANASAHLKTGSLNEVNALAGYVDGRSGKRYVLVAFINHPNAAVARPALDALVDWTAQD